MVSVIIPIYNTQPYLRKCLDSVIIQDYKELEIILIDDGSTDGSGDICDEYAQADKRIRVVHRENSGLVSARKKGLKLSSGELIFPMDSDDYIEPTTIGQMVKIVTEYNVDIVQCGVKYIFADGREMIYDEPLEQGLYNLEDHDCEAHRYLFWDYKKEKRGIRSNLWSCIFKKRLINKYQMLVSDELTNGEDDACFYPAFLNAKSYYLIDKPLYIHIFRKESMSGENGDFSLDQVMKIGEAIKPHLKFYLDDSYLYMGYKRYLFCRIESVMHYAYNIEFAYNYVFPADIVPYGSKIIVYGAGRIGQSYVAQNDNLNWFEMVAWVDSYKRGSLGDKLVEAPEIINSLDYDFILLSVGISKFDEIYDFLIKTGIDKEKILWRKPESHAFTRFFLHN